MLLNALCAGAVGYILDAVLVLGLLIYVMICGKRGFVKMLFRFASGLIAFIAAIALAKVAVSLTGGLFGLMPQGRLRGRSRQAFGRRRGSCAQRN